MQLNFLDNRCEDYPCCGHEAGCCPDFDESGQQLNMRCTCGAGLPLKSRFSICASCIGLEDEDQGEYYSGYGSGEDDLADFNTNERDDYNNE